MDEGWQLEKRRYCCKFVSLIWTEGMITNQVYTDIQEGDFKGEVKWKELCCWDIQRTG